MTKDHIALTIAMVPQCENQYFLRVAQATSCRNLVHLQSIGAGSQMRGIDVISISSVGTAASTSMC